jgi:hypothetical protein
MMKDLTDEREAARLGVTLETATSALAPFDCSLAAGHGDLDFAGVVEAERDRSR